MLTAKECKCRYCTEVSPRHGRVRAALNSQELVEDFDWLMGEWMNEGLDGNVAEAKLDGSWDGWEWIKEEKKKRGLK